MRPRPLVVLLADELDARHLGVAGRADVSTPHLDRLARRGRYFRSTYTPSPICVPARAAMATGEYVHRIGYWDNALAYDGRVPGWGHSLQNAGIRVESIGKLHYVDAAAPTGFDRQILPMHLAGGKGMIWGSIRDPLPTIDYRRRPRMIGERVGPGESDYTRFDRRVSDEAVAWLEAASRQDPSVPWVLFVGFVAPHFPLVAPEEHAALYPPERIKLPRLRPEHGYRRHPWVQAMHDYWPHDEGFADDDERRRAIAMYGALCSFLDAQVGRIVRTLETTGLSATTRILFTSDHGDNLGNRGMWGKSTLYEDSVAVPAILAGPDVAPGLRDDPVSLLDLHPTILEAVGLDADAAKAGRSLFAPAPTRPRTIFGEYHAVGAASGAFMVRREEWKYHHYVGYPPELFDLKRDPDESVDRAADPTCAAIVRALEAELTAICDPVEVDRRAKQVQAALIARHGGRERALALGNIGATPPPEAA